MMKRFAIFLMFVLIAAPVQAAQFFADPGVQTVGKGDVFTVNFFLDTQDEDINAIEGTVVYPESVFALKEVNDSNSIIHFWVEKPQPGSSGARFSGIVTGGYSGESGLVISMTFEALAEGGGLIEIQGARVLKNDGQGTELAAGSHAAQVSVSGEARVATLQPRDDDTEPPENFTPEVGRVEGLFDGNPFVAFGTQDKGSGIDYYEVCEGEKDCVQSDGLYVLENGGLKEDVTIRAVDRNGNVRTVTLPAEGIAPWRPDQTLILASIAIALALLTIIGWILYWKRRRQEKA